jgi:hypothetical protein
MGCPFRRGQSLCVHVQRQSTVCVPYQFLDSLYVLTAAFQERCERSAEEECHPRALVMPTRLAAGMHVAL